LTPVGHPFITHPARRFAPITVRQDWKAVRQELEQVSDSIGIRTQGADPRGATSRGGLHQP
jgi:hypothetical protein